MLAAHHFKESFGPVVHDVVYLDGRYVARPEALVSVDDRGYQFGDGVYEVTRFQGRRPVRLVRHLQRLQESLAHLRIVGAPSIAEWESIIHELAERSNLSPDPNVSTILYQQVTRGVAPRNHFFPLAAAAEPGKPAVKPVASAGFRPAPVYPAELRARGVTLSIQPDERWDRCYIKSLNLLSAIMAKQAARDAGAFEALLVRDGIVTEGGSTNAWCVRGGVLWTHPEGGRILSGVVREMVLEAAGRSGVQVRQEPVRLESFRAADEVFMTSTTMDIMPVSMIEGQPVGSGRPGPTTLELSRTLAQMVADEIS